jgi:hypothetical protein
MAHVPRNAAIANDQECRYLSHDQAHDVCAVFGRRPFIRTRPDGVEPYMNHKIYVNLPSSKDASGKSAKNHTQKAKKPFVLKALKRAGQAHDFCL